MFTGRNRPSTRTVPAQWAHLAGRSLLGDQGDIAHFRSDSRADLEHIGRLFWWVALSWARCSWRLLRSRDRGDRIGDRVARRSVRFDSDRDAACFDELGREDPGPRTYRGHNTVGVALDEAPPRARGDSRAARMRTRRHVGRNRRVPPRDARSRVSQPKQSSTVWQDSVMDLGLVGYGIVVTGGSSGIGLATAKLLLDEGAIVTICGRNIDRLRAAEAELDSPHLLAVQADVLDPGGAERVVIAAVERAGRLDGVAAVAGRGRRGSLLELDPSVVVDEVSDKLLALLNIARPAVQHLREAGGSIVALTAPTGFEPTPAMGAIGVGRAALANAVRALALELAADQVRVNAVGVGMIDTPRQQHQHANDGTHMAYAEWLANEAKQRNTPLQRAGTDTEVASAIAYLLSSRSSFTTGAVLDVTGGHRSQ